MGLCLGQCTETDEFLRKETVPSAELFYRLALYLTSIYAILRFPI